MMNRNKLLMILAFCILPEACSEQDKQKTSDDCDYDSIEMIIVNKIPRGIFADEEMPELFRNVGWYEIGLSRNGKEPVEYIWRANAGHNHYIVLNAEIGDRG